MTNCKHCGNKAVLEGDGIHEERGYVCTAHCNQETHDCPYDGERLDVSGAGEFTCPSCWRVFDENLKVKKGDPLFSKDELLRLFGYCDMCNSLDPFFEQDGFTMLASIAKAFRDCTDDFKHKDVRIQWRHEPFEGMELLGKTAEWEDIYSTAEGEG
jgi:hypothetical protein